MYYYDIMNGVEVQSNYSIAMDAALEARFS
jgi:hypothetical protein